MNKVFFWVLYGLQVIISFSCFNSPGYVPAEGLIKFFLLYVITWYLFKIPFITVKVVNKATIGGTLMFYLLIIGILIFTKDAVSGWSEIIGLLFILFLIPLTVFFLGYVRLKEIGIDILKKIKSR